MQPQNLRNEMRRKLKISWAAGGRNSTDRIEAGRALGSTFIRHIAGPLLLSLNWFWEVVVWEDDGAANQPSMGPLCGFPCIVNPES